MWETVRQNILSRMLLGIPEFSAVNARLSDLLGVGMLDRKSR